MSFCACVRGISASRSVSSDRQTCPGYGIRPPNPFQSQHFAPEPTHEPTLFCIVHSKSDS